MRDSAAGRWLLEGAGLEDYVKLLASDAQPILRGLPKRLAEDLQQSLPPRSGSQILGQWSGCRAVILFDGCEWLDDDAWLRSFCGREIPAQFVFAGQKPLDWRDPLWSTPEALEQRSLAGLPEADAREYLKLREVTDPALQDDVLDSCRETDGNTYHSLSLGWCADTVLLEREHGRPIERFRIPSGDLYALAERFLRAMPEDEQRWIESLALSPRFDETAARWQYSGSRSRAQDAAWTKLLAFSIVAPLGGGWWTLRPLARRSITARLRDGRPEKLRRERQHWRDYWSERAGHEMDDAVELTWVQQWFLDPKPAGVVERIRPPSSQSTCDGGTRESGAHATPAG